MVSVLTVQRGAAEVKSSDDAGACRMPWMLDGQAGIGATRHDMLIYKLFRPAEWDVLRTEGETLGAPVDVADGFVHFSTAEQVRETAARHFAGEGDLVLLTMDADLLGPDLKWEPSRGGALFPHLYRMLRLDDVVAEHPVHLDRGGGHVFPAEIP